MCYHVRTSDDWVFHDRIDDGLCAGRRGFVMVDMLAGQNW